jgi:hypothetical protein
MLFVHSPSVRFDMAAKRHKKHKNIVSGLEISILNELPRGKPRSIGAKTTGVAHKETAIFRAHFF